MSEDPLSLAPKILILDDNEEISLLLKAILELEGFRADVAHNSKQFMISLKGTKPDLIMLDLIMPDVGCRISPIETHLISSKQDHLISGKEDHPISGKEDHQ